MRPSRSLGLMSVSVNLGVEVGQLALVTGSPIIAALASAWLIEWALNLKPLPPLAECRNTWRLSCSCRLSGREENHTLPQISALDVRPEPQWQVFWCGVLKGVP